MHPVRSRDVYVLSNAHSNGALLRVTCQGCSPARHYFPTDLMTLFGDMPVMNLEDCMSCERCRQRVRVRAVHPTAAERIGMRVRKLDEVKMVRRVRWREVTL
jgi:flavoprotein